MSALKGWALGMTAQALILTPLVWYLKPTHLESALIGVISGFVGAWSGLGIARWSSEK